jgi:Flp pilus assembly protein TadG
MKTRRPKNHVMPARALGMQAGAAAVELAIVTVLMLMIVAGIVEFGRTFWYADALAKATRDGARLMSNWPAATIQSAGTSAAQVLARDLSNAAHVSPAVASGNVVVECLNDTFNVISCSDGSAPANVRVRITGFSVRLGDLMPFVGVADGDYGIVSLAPHTTMRYMNGGVP